jgi:succinylglutamate desuccinylase
MTDKLNKKLDELISKFMTLHSEQADLALRQQGQLNGITVVLFALLQTLTEDSPKFRAKLASRIKDFSPIMKDDSLPLHDEILDFFLKHFGDNPDISPQKPPWLRSVLKGGLSEDDEGQ